MLDARIGQHPLVVGLADDEHGGHAIESRPKNTSRSPLKCPSPAAARTLCPRRMPRNAQLSSAPDSRAETMDGASLWASGSQVCMGARPILVP